MDSLFLTSRRHWWEQVNNTVIESHLSVTSGLSWARTQPTGLTDRDTNDCAISPHPLGAFIRHTSNKVRVIHDLLWSAGSSENDFIPVAECVLTYVRVDHAAELCLQYDMPWLIKMD